METHRALSDAYSTPRPSRLYVETDFHEDVDDAGAIAIAHVLADQRRVQLLGVGINTSSRWGPGAVRAINSFYGRLNLPVGARMPATDDLAQKDYARRVAEEFSEVDWCPERGAPTLLEQILKESPDSSVTVVSLGFFHNLLDVLKARDGRDLIRQKVGRTVVMGGYFPSGEEWNFAQFPLSTREFISQWPTPIDFVGWEAGHNVITGDRIQWPQSGRNPIQTAYEAFGASRGGRPSWDLIAVDAAVMPDRVVYSWSEPGTVHVNDDGSNQWNSSSVGQHRFLRMAGSPSEMAEILNEMLQTQPRAVSLSQSGGDVAWPEEL